MCRFKICVLYFERTHYFNETWIEFVNVLCVTFLFEVYLALFPSGHYFSHNRGKSFSTRGRDNDECGDFYCAEKHRSGWWHSDYRCSWCHGIICSHFHYAGSCHSICTEENLNGDYNGGNGQRIFSYYQYNCNLRYVEMKIRPISWDDLLMRWPTLGRIDFQIVCEKVRKRKKLISKICHPQFHPSNTNKDHIDSKIC